MTTPTTGEPDALLILWTSADREAALNMVLMYGLNSLLKNWWGGVVLLAWGPSQRLLVEDGGVQARVAEMRAAGARVIACKACADRLSVAGDLTALGVEVLYTGELLTNWIKSGKPVLSV